jgi:hypothetical protein
MEAFAPFLWLFLATQIVERALCYGLLLVSPGTFLA